LLIIIGVILLWLLLLLLGWLLLLLSWLLLSKVEETNVDKRSFAEVGSLSKGNVGCSLSVVHSHLTNVGLRFIALSKKLLKKNVSLTSDVEEEFIIVIRFLLLWLLLLLLWLLLLLGWAWA